MYNQCNLFSETYMDVSQQQDGLSEISSDESGKKLTLSKLLQGPQNKVWYRALSNELGRLTLGNNYGVKHTNCMIFVHHHQYSPPNQPMIESNGFSSVRIEMECLDD